MPHTFSAPIVTVDGTAGDGPRAASLPYDGDGEGGNEAERLVSGGSGYLRAGVAEG